jgi:hypothetical protein
MLRIIQILGNYTTSQKPPSLNDRDQLDHTMGFWVDIHELGEITFNSNGTEPASNQTIPLYQGWNMVGYPSLTDHNRTLSLNNLVFGIEVDCIQWFDSSTKTWHFLDESDSFVVGRGYWFHTTTDCTWEVPL